MPNLNKKSQPFGSLPILFFLEVSQMEQLSRKNNIIIRPTVTGVPKTFAERTSDTIAENEAAHQSSRRDTIKATSSLIQEACNISISNSDI